MGGSSRIRDKYVNESGGLPIGEDDVQVGTIADFGGSVILNASLHFVDESKITRRFCQ
jgi:hypothetical protein